MRLPRLFRRREPDLGIRVDPTLRIDPSAIDVDAWLAWAEENLTPLDLARFKRAAEADRIAAATPDPSTATRKRSTK